MLSIFKSKRIILASASPRRRELLSKAGIEFSIQVADIDETIDPSKPIEEEVKRLAVNKAYAVRDRVTGVILAADTVVVYNGRVLTKPGSYSEAKAMLQLLSGREHEVLTGYALVDTESSKELVACIRTKVEFFPMPDSFIEWYLDVEDYQDKAGAYAIQEKGMLMVKRIEGSYPNIVGLPVEYVYRDLVRLQQENNE